MKKLLFLLCLVLGTTLKPLAQCSANFTWSQTNPNEITFTNTSTGGTTADYIWDFGDGNLSYATNPVHTFSIPGTYNVCLVMDDSASSCNSTFCDNITVTGTVICNFDANVTTYSATCATCADGSAVSIPTGGTAPYQFQWSNSSTSQTLTGLLPGSYWVCVTDTNGCNDCDTVTVLYSTCMASFTQTLSGNVGTFVSTSTGTTSGTSYNWSFGDGGYGSGTPISHTYASPGDYEVCLTIYESATGCNHTTCDSLWVIPSSTCNASFTLYPDSSLPHTYWGVNASTGTGLSYTWHWGDGSTSTGPYPSHTYADSGIYNICLVVAGGGCIDSVCSTYTLLRMASAAPITVNIISTTAGLSDNGSGVNSKLVVFPNPATRQVRFLGPQGLLTGKVTADLIDVNGKLQRHFENLPQGILDLEDIPPGFYLIKAQGQEGSFTGKILVK